MVNSKCLAAPLTATLEGSGVEVAVLTEETSVVVMAEGVAITVDSIAIVVEGTSVGASVVIFPGAVVPDPSLLEVAVSLVAAPEGLGVGERSHCPATLLTPLP